MASEDVIQFLWKHKLSQRKLSFCTCGLDLVVLSPGEQNFHAGPDFFNARIKLGNLIWAGNIEVHQKASDWYRHSHHIDPAYNNVILHLVVDYDADIYNSLGRRIPTLVTDYPDSLIQRYLALKNNEDWLPCGIYLSEFPAGKLKKWLSYLMKQRSQNKCQDIFKLSPSLLKNREEAFYRTLASGYGLSLNSLPFELLSKSIPLNKLSLFRDNLFDLEALFYGHSGLLYPAKDLSPYPSSLWETYKDLRHFVKGDPVPRHLWKFLRLRPASFPTLRISQFVSMLHHTVPLLENILAISSLSEMEQLFRESATAYWDTHYLFGKCSPPKKKYLGQHAVNTLIINRIIPFLQALEQIDPHRSSTNTGAFLTQMKAESNQIIRNWSSYGIRAKNAGESQALLQLFNVYCKQKRCLDCQIGSGILEASIYEKQ
jgi:hypothetical protein